MVKVPFMGELMVCVLCGEKQRSDPQVESQWRAVVVEGRTFYACPKEFPPDSGDGSGVDAFRDAYARFVEEVVRRLGHG